MAGKRLKQTNKSEISCPTDGQSASAEILTPRKIRHRKLAQGVLAGKTLREIGREVYPNAENPSQTVSNCLRHAGPQAAIREEAAKIDFTKSDIREAVARRIARIKSSDAELKQGDSKVLEIAARIEAMLTDRQLVEQVISTDELTRKAEEAIARLKTATNNSDYVTHEVSSNADGVQSATQSHEDDRRATHRDTDGTQG